MMIIINRFDHDFRVAGARQHVSEQRKKRNVFSLDLKTAAESLLRTVFGSEFQTAGAEHRKARFANVVTCDSFF